MFCDLVGSTALSARVDPEVLRELIGAFDTCVAAVIGRYDGTVARYLGDCVLAYFGYPTAHEDDAERAVRAGLELTDAVAHIQTGIDAALEVRVGIATGMVVVGDLIGEGAAQERAVFGETPNLAARLQMIAEPGTVVICPSTRRVIGRQFEILDLAPVALKGFAEPVPAAQVLRTSGVESRFEAHHDTRLTALLGRDEGMDLLLRRWRQAAQGNGCVVLLTGEAGIGKSHIALALQERLRSEPHIRLRYFCSAHHTNSALFPFINQLERAARFERGDSAAVKLAKLEAVLEASAADGDHTVALVANLLSLPPDDRYRLPDISPQKRKEQTFAALLAQLVALAARQPVLIVFEDVHWIDPTSLELLTLTVERAAHLPVLLLITGRTDFTPPWPSHAHTKTMMLTRLNRAHAVTLIQQITAGRALPEEVMNQILARTDGVPLFVEELTKAVLETGYLQQRNGEYVLDRPLPPVAIPTTLHASLTARLDRSALVREVAQIGAAVGREFHYELLSAVAGLAQEKLNEALRQLVRSELVFRRGEAPQAVYRFKHALVRDAAYGGLLKCRRAQLHGAIANALERQFPEIAEAEPETLAHHFTEAGLIAKSIRYWLQAGKNAAGRSANLEAIAHLQRGIDAVRRMADGSVGDRMELDLQLALGPCLIATQGPASSMAVATFARARELCERLDYPQESLHVMFWLTTVSVVRGELPRALETVADILRRADPCADRPAWINASRGQGMILLFMGHVVEARAAVEQALEAFNASEEPVRLATRSAGQDAGAAGLALMSWALWVLGHVDEAVTRIEAALQRADAVRHPFTLAYVLYYAAVLHALRGKPELAHDYAERCLALSEEHGFRQWRGLSRAVRGISLTMLDPSSRAIDEAINALNEYRGAGYQLGITVLYGLLSPVLLLREQADVALDFIEHGLSIVSRNSERIFEADLYRLKARALLARNVPAAANRAQSLLKQALATAGSQCARSLELRAARDLAAVWSGQGRREEALDLLAPMSAWFNDGLDAQDLTEARTLLDQLRYRAA